VGKQRDPIRLRPSPREIQSIFTNLRYLLRNVNLFLQALVRWLRNTWRGEKRLSKTPLKKYRMQDLLWWLKKKDVMEEISKISGIEDIDTNHPEWFSYRITASKNILSEMTESEKDSLRRKGELFSKEGLPEDLKRK
jgi:hypothetical protein